MRKKLKKINSQSDSAVITKIISASLGISVNASAIVPNKIESNHKITAAVLLEIPALINR